MNPKEKAREVFKSRGSLPDVKSIARKQFACHVTKRSMGTGGLSGLCIPLSSTAPDHLKGFKYAIVYDDSKGHTADFIVAHELGHVVSNTFGRLVPSHRQDAVEKWCDDFAYELCRLLSDC